MEKRSSSPPDVFNELFGKYIKQNRSTNKIARPKKFRAVVGFCDGSNPCENMCAIASCCGGGAAAGGSCCCD